jgi:hypothetical protein
MARSRTSFRTGNTAAIKHGGRSPRMLLLNRDSVVADAEARLGELTDHLPAASRALADQYVDVVTQLKLVNAWLDRQGGALITSRGGPRSCAPLWLSLHGLLLRIWDRLEQAAAADSGPDVIAALAARRRPA